jgi:predicted GNAT family acetyltransferase
MLQTASGVRDLRPDDVPALRRLLARDAEINVFVDHRVELTRLEPRWLGGEVWGYCEDGELVAACHYAANVVPVHAGPPAIEAFAARAGGRRRTCGSLVGPQDQVLALWERLEPVWGAARSVRPDQPFLVMRAPSAVAPDPLVRQVALDEVDALYPASVAMYTEEVGVSPETGSDSGYRGRVAQLIRRGWAFARIEDGEVVFKAEVGAATQHACQVQGVWVRPDRRGEGLAGPAMAAVVDLALRHVSPVVTLYVNASNTAARSTYARVGFERTGTFSTVLF